MRFPGSAARPRRTHRVRLLGREKRGQFRDHEDPGSETDVIAHKLMNEKYGDRVQIVIDDAAVTQLRYIIPFLGAKDRKTGQEIRYSSSSTRPVPLPRPALPRKWCLDLPIPNVSRNSSMRAETPPLRA